MDPSHGGAQALSLPAALQERAIEHRVIPWCEAHGVAIVAYSPFGSGDFPAPASPGGHVLAEIAASEHASQNAGAGDLTLSGDKIARIDTAFPLRRPGRLPMI